MKIFNYLFLIAALTLGLSSCVDNNFDEPTGGITIDTDKVVPISTVLAAIEAGGKTYDEDHYISGTVTADDASGNFYKMLVMQNGDDAISISIDQNELNAAYPKGSTVFVKLKGLYLGKNNNLPQIGLGFSNNRPGRIPDALVAEHIISGGNSGAAIEPEVVTIKDIVNGGSKYYNKLVKINDVEFKAQYVGATYATPETTSGQRAENREITDCDENEIIVRNSDFASFATQPLPTGNGSIVAIASIYRTTFQLFIRDTDDLDMMGKRCDGGGGQAANEITIGSIKERYYDLGVDKAEEGYIKGLVISDRTTKITHEKNLMLQNGKDGILVRFANAHNFDLGEELQITVTGVEVSEFNDVLQLNKVPNINVKSLSKGNELQPITATIEQIKADFNAYESTLVKIEMATLPEGKKFSDRFNIVDPTGEIQLYTATKATFREENVPAGSVVVTGIPQNFKENQQIIVNGPSYIEGGSTGGGGGTGGGDDNTEISIASVREAFAAGSSKTPKGFITGVVISDKNTGQVNNKNAIIQNGESGILVRFKDAHNLSLGDEVKVVVSDVELSEYRAVLQINGVELAAASKTGTGQLPAPRNLTVEAYLAKADTYESTRVRIVGATLSSDSGTYDAAVTIDDGTGTVVTYIGKNADFKGDNLPSGKIVVTGIGSAFNTPQILINSKSDVTPE